MTRRSTLKRVYVRKIQLILLKNSTKIAILEFFNQQTFLLPSSSNSQLTGINTNEITFRWMHRRRRRKNELHVKGDKRFTRDAVAFYATHKCRARASISTRCRDNNSAASPSTLSRIELARTAEVRRIGKTRKPGGIQETSVPLPSSIAIPSRFRERVMNES